ncbi:hypothetical protein ABZ135_18235 [Streptomyces sp. NPDC006339]|uniref:hypothetical protein n=1 Tax=Streptomyces sp. NPDC006339 TaxID=3156755 RepID=UPI0033ACB1CC
MNARSGPGSAGALLLCRAEATAVRPPARLLPEQPFLAPAGPGWTVLVPEGKPWLDDAEPVERVVTGWATALAVGTAGRPVLALWWDADRAGFTLASGFRRTVGYTWLADGTPVGEDEAVHTFADRLALDPVLDVQALEPLTKPDPDADAAARLVGLVAVLARTGLALPDGLAPGESTGKLRAAARDRGAELLERPGVREFVRAGPDAVEDGGRPGPGARGRGARLLGAVQLAAGVPLLVRGIGRRSGGWTTAGALLVAHGALALVRDRPRASRQRLRLGD